jgi:hypothetical protein
MARTIEAANDHKVGIVHMRRLVTKLLGPPEEVDTCARFPGYLHRWMVFGTQRFKVYLHHSSNEDLAVDLLSYPKRLISIGFVNSCREDCDGAPDACADRATWMVVIAKSSHNHQESHLGNSPSLRLPSTFAKH